MLTKLQITAEDLVELEQAISGISTSNAKRDAQKQKDQSSGSSNGNEGTGYNGPETSSERPTLPSGTEWQALQAYQALQQEEAIKREQQRAREKQLNLRASLDAQMAEVKAARARSRQDDKEYLQNITEDLQRFNSEKEERLHKLHEAHERERRAWEEQIEMEKERRRREKEAMVEQEKLELQRIADAIAAEKGRLAAKREEEHQKNLKIIAENEENKRLREIQKQKEAEEDHRLMQEYAAKLDREAKQREEAFQRRMQTLEKFTKWADDGPVGKGRRDEEMKFEMQLLREQEKKAERDRQREIDDERRRRERTLKMQDENLRQLQLRKELSEAEKAKDAEYAEKFRRESEEYAREQRRRRTEEKQQRLKYGNSLKNQLAGQRENLDVMNQAERSMNSDLLKAIVDPDTYGRIEHRLRMRSSQG